MSFYKINFVSFIITVVLFFCIFRFLNIIPNYYINLNDYKFDFENAKLFYDDKEVEILNKEILKSNNVCLEVNNIEITDFNRESNVELRDSKNNFYYQVKGNMLLNESEIEELKKIEQKNTLIIYLKSNKFNDFYRVILAYKKAKNDWHINAN